VQLPDPPASQAFRLLQSIVMEIWVRSMFGWLSEIFASEIAAAAA
jgi:hypothetical protein